MADENSFNMSFCQIVSLVALRLLSMTGISALLSMSFNTGVESTKPNLWVTRK